MNIRRILSSSILIINTPELLLDVTPSFGPEMSDGPGDNFESTRVGIANQYVFMQTS